MPPPPPRLITYTSNNVSQEILYEQVQEISNQNCTNDAQIDFMGALHGSLREIISKKPCKEQRQIYMRRKEQAKKHIKKQEKMLDKLYAQAPVASLESEDNELQVRIKILNDKLRKATAKRPYALQVEVNTRLEEYGQEYINEQEELLKKIRNAQDEPTQEPARKKRKN